MYLREKICDHDVSLKDNIISAGRPASHIKTSNSRNEVPPDRRKHLLLHYRNRNKGCFSYIFSLFTFVSLLKLFFNRKILPHQVIPT